MSNGIVSDYFASAKFHTCKQVVGKKHSRPFVQLGNLVYWCFAISLAKYLYMAIYWYLVAYWCSIIVGHILMLYDIWPSYIDMLQKRKWKYWTQLTCIFTAFQVYLCFMAISFWNEQLSFNGPPFAELFRTYDREITTFIETITNILIKAGFVSISLGQNRSHVPNT